MSVEKAQKSIGLMKVTEEPFIEEAINGKKVTTKTAHNNPPTAKQINVTDLTPKQQRELFCDCVSQAGFTGFTKKKNFKIQRQVPR